MFCVHFGDDFDSQQRCVQRSTVAGLLECKAYFGHGQGVFRRDDITNGIIKISGGVFKVLS